MSRTYVPPPGPLKIFQRRKTILKWLYEDLKFVQADYDKAGDMMDWNYYEGYRDALAHTIAGMTKLEGASPCRLLLLSYRGSALRLLRRLS